MSGSGRETLLDVQKLLGVHLRYPGVVGRSSRMSGCGRQTLGDFGSGREASRLSGSGWEALTDVRDWSGSPRGCPGVVGRQSRMSGSGREVRGEVREWS